jgi:hypothetical protein
VARCLSTLVVMVVLLSGFCCAQIAPGDITASRDTLRTSTPKDATDTLRTVVYPRKSTVLAMGLSAILPGAGQFYNESYWKAPLVLGLGVYFVSEFLKYNRYADDYRKLYLVSLATTPVTAYQTKRDQYKDQRDANIWYFVIVYVLNIVDAYVDASLYGFDVSPTLSLRSLERTVGLSLRVMW